jgi:elongation factor Ts
MSNIDNLKKLREETGVSFSLCKKALDEAVNDIENAKKLLSKWGVEKAEGKSGRDTKNGSIFSYIHHNKKVGVMLEILCETDFVARNSDFQELGNNIAMHIASMKPENLDELLKQDYVMEPSKTIETLLKEAILKIGENLKIGNFVRYEL